jgi:hypothetical protein
LAALVGEQSNREIGELFGGPPRLCPPIWVARTSYEVGDGKMCVLSRRVRLVLQRCGKL